MTKKIEVSIETLALVYTNGINRGIEEAESVRNQTLLEKNWRLSFVESLEELNELFLDALLDKVISDDIIETWIKKENLR
jgi:hypothetical protein